MIGGELRLRLVGKPIDIRGFAVFGDKPFDIADFRGKTVLVDFWATWCVLCRKELPHIRAMYAAYHGKGFEIVGISVDENRTALERFVKKQELPWPILADYQPERRNVSTLLRQQRVGITVVGLASRAVLFRCGGQPPRPRDFLRHALGCPRVVVG